MTTAELKAALKSGKTMDELFHYAQGDECLIFKADKFALDDEIRYIPDIDSNEIPMDEAVTDDKSIEDILDCCYTGLDFARECMKADVDKKYAERLFWLCNWQHPSTILNEGWPNDGETSED